MEGSLGTVDGDGRGERSVALSAQHGRDHSIKCYVFARPCVFSFNFENDAEWRSFACGAASSFFEHSLEESPSIVSGGRMRCVSGKSPPYPGSITLRREEHCMRQSYASQSLSVPCYSLAPRRAQQESP